MKKLVSVLLLALLLRLISLSQSFWLDEAISANVVKNYSFSGIISTFSPSDFHPPLFYLLLKAWSLLFGTSVVGLRLFSVTASVLAGLFLYQTAKLLFGNKTALWSTALFMFNPLFVYYSQELRMYSLVTLFLSISTYYFMSILKSKTINLKSILLFNLFIFLSFLTFYGSIFYIFSLYFLLFIQKKYSLLSKLIPGFILSLLLIYPLLYQQLFTSRTLLASVANWSLVLGKSNLKNLLLIPLKFAFGRISFYPKSVYYLLSSTWTIYIFFKIFIFYPVRNAYMRSLQFLLFFPLFLAFLISFKFPMLQYFRYLYLLPILSLLLSQSHLKLIILSGFVILSFIYLLNPNFHREDWQSLSASLPDNATVYMISSFVDPINYYRPDIVIKDLRAIEPGDQSTKELIVIPYGTDIYGLNYQQTLYNLGFHIELSFPYRSVLHQIFNKDK